MKQQQQITHSLNDNISLIGSIKSSFLKDIKAQIKDKKINDDRKYILKMLLKAVKSLYYHNIYIFPNIIELFQIHGFKGSTLYYDAICKISQKIQHELKGRVEWINHRALKKGKKNDKNIIICCLLFSYREYFLKYLEEFLSENKENDEVKIRNLISKLRRILSETSQNNNKHINLSTTVSDDDTITEEQNIYEQKNEKEIIDTRYINTVDNDPLTNEQYMNEQIKEKVNNNFSSVCIDNDDNIIEQVQNFKVEHKKIGIIDFDGHNLLESYNTFDECKEYNEYTNFEDEYIYNSVVATTTKIY